MPPIYPATYLPQPWHPQNSLISLGSSMHPKMPLNPETQAHPPPCPMNIGTQSPSALHPPPGPHHPSRTLGPLVSCSLQEASGCLGSPAETTRPRWAVQEPLLFNPSVGGNWGDAQLPVKGSGQGSEYSWRHGIAVWRVFVSRGVPTVYSIYPGGEGLPEATGGTHSGRGIWEQFCPIEVPMDATWGSQYGVQSF